MRPDRLLLVAGTGTEVGKTWVACGLAQRLRADGRTVAARKPAQSYDLGTPESVTDAGLLAAATGSDPREVCPPHRWYPVAMAPPMAADWLGQDPVLLADLIGETTWSSGTEVGLLETAGGLRSPLAHDGDAVDLIRALRPDLIVIVAHAMLGVLHAIGTCIDALETVEGAAERAVFYLNHHDEDDDLHRRNRDWLVERWERQVCTDLDALVTSALTGPLNW